MMGMMVFILGLLILMMNNKYLFMVLMSMELMMMGLFFYLMFNQGVDIMNMSMGFLIMVVIEACLSLMLLVLMVKYYYLDNIKVLNLINL